MFAAHSFFMRDRLVSFHKVPFRIVWNARQAFLRCRYDTFNVKELEELSQKKQAVIELVYRIQPSVIPDIIDRLDDIASDKMTGVTLLKTGTVYRLILAVVDQETAQRVEMRLKEFLPSQVRRLKKETLMENLKHFDLIMPGDAFNMWRESGWENAIRMEDVADWLEEKKR